MQEGWRYAGAAVTTAEEVIWAEPTPTRMSAQQVIALNEALKLRQGQKVNVYIDGWYAFAMVHLHGAIYKERRLLTVEGKVIKNKDEILAFLKALWLPKKLAIIHCPGHQTGNGPQGQQSG